MVLELLLKTVSYGVITRRIGTHSGGVHWQVVRTSC